MPMFLIPTPHCVSAFVLGRSCPTEACRCLKIFPDIVRVDPEPIDESQPRYRSRHPRVPDTGVTERLFCLFRMLDVSEVTADFDGGGDSGQVYPPTIHFVCGSLLETLWETRDTFLADLCAARVEFETSASMTEASRALYEVFDERFTAIVYDHFGSFAGEFSVSGRVVWDIHAGTIEMAGTEQDRMEMLEPYASESSRLYDIYGHATTEEEKNAAYAAWDRYRDEIEDAEELYATDDISDYREYGDDVDELYAALTENILALERARLLNVLLQKKDLSQAWLWLEEALFEEAS